MAANDSLPYTQNKDTSQTGNTIFELIKGNPWFFSLYGLFLIVGLALLLAFPKGEILLWLNRQHTPLLDNIAYYVTFMGDGLFVGILLIPLAFIRIRHSVQLLVSYLITGAVVQILKQVFGMPRPLKYFGDAIALQLVEGIKVWSNASFPSGHSTTAFSLFLVLSIIVKNKYWGIAFFFAALTVALSRVYAVQHFFMDIYFGSLTGVIFTLLAYRWVDMFAGWKNVRWLLPNAPQGK